MENSSQHDFGKAERDGQRAVATAASAIDRVADQAQSIAKQGIDSVTSAARAAQDSASQSSEAIVTYTRENPVKALLIAAVSGALFLTVMKALTPSRG